MSSEPDVELAEFHAVFHRNVALVEFDSEEKATAIMEASGLRGFVIGELTPTALLIDPNKIATLTDRFRELGYTPNVQGSD